MNKNTRFKIINVIFVGILFVIGYVLFLKPTASLDSKNDLTQILDSSNDALGVSQSAQDHSMANNRQENQREDKQIDLKSKNDQPHVSTKNKSITSEDLIKINKFKILNKKVIISNDEKKSLIDLLKDKQLIQGIGQAFRDASINDLIDQSDVHDVIYDFLIEALNKGDHELALAVIKEIILDQNIENDSISMDLRTFFGESKAELLYHASSLYPDEFKNIKSVLPGPVTQKNLAQCAFNAKRK